MFSGDYGTHKRREKDAVRRTLTVTNTSGAVVWKGYYEPFGNEYAIQGTIGNDVRFAGNKKDDETGLNYFGARYMDSALGRFHAPDPVGPVDSKTGKINDKILTQPQRLNAYAYALNGPGRYLDRDGKQAIEAAELIVIGVSALAAVGIQQWMSKPKKDGSKGSAPSFAGESTPAPGPGSNLDPDKEPRLKRVHSDDTIKNSNKSGYEYWNNRSTQEIVDSLKPGSEEPMVVRPDGTILNGNTRALILEERGIDINSLSIPRTY